MQEIPLPINEDGMPVLEGIIERVIYQNEENGYTVCEMAVGEAEEITLVGTMPFLCAGETITASGEWVLHPSFGRQFKVSYYEKKLPSQVSPGTKYLPKYDSAGNVKQIKMYDDYGREIGWVDYTDHGYRNINSPNYHTVPHWHEKIYNSIFRDGKKINHRTDIKTPLGDI